jgi:hypothetical protein
LTTRERSNTVTETGIAFFSAGGHSHDGINSSIIDTTKYSIFDFNFGLISTNSARVNTQLRNERAFSDFIMKVVNQSVLAPAGVVLQDNVINSRNIIAGSITSTEIAANTITANNIAANTITGDLIQAGTITADLLAANALIASSILLNNGDFWNSTGAFRLGGANGITYGGSGTIGIGSSVLVSGVLAAVAGNIGGWSISSTSLSAGSTTLFSDGLIVANLFRSSSNIFGPRIELGVNVGNGEEIQFYSGFSGRGTIRNPGPSGASALRLSAGRLLDLNETECVIQANTRVTFSRFEVGNAAAGLEINTGSHFRSRTIHDTTTASAANVFIASSPFALFRSTSSIKYKKDIEDIDDFYAKSILNLRPVWYRSLCEGDPDEYSYYGFIAEEVAEVDPRLVHWGNFRSLGFVTNDYGEEVEVKEEGHFPEGVQYDRLTPHIVYLLKDLYSKIEYLENLVKGE